MAIFIGMKGTGDFEPNQIPESWNEAVLMWWPNGDTPITAMLSKLQTKVVDSYIWNWWTEEMPKMSSAIEALYSNVGLTTLRTAAVTAGESVYVHIKDENYNLFREGHIVTFQNIKAPRYDVQGRVIAKGMIDAVVASDGPPAVTAVPAKYYLTVRMIDSDTGTAAKSNIIADATRIMIIGNSNPEGALMPQPQAEHPVQWQNYSQIFATSLSITGTAKETELRTQPNEYARMKRNCLRRHAREKEMAIIHGVASYSINANKKPERTTMGIKAAILGTPVGTFGGKGGVVSDYPSDPDFTGMNWTVGGEEWLDKNLELCFRYGSTTLIAYGGSLAFKAINDLVKAKGTFDFNAETAQYGIQIRQWVTMHGILNFKVHPLFSIDPALQRTIMVIDSEQLIYRPLRNRDTKFIKDHNSGHGLRDSTDEMFRTECGLQFGNPSNWAWLTNLGVNNDLS
jgi:hypothetical protein